MPSLKPVDEQYFTSAPVRHSDTFVIARPAQDVWAELISDAPLDWCKELSIRWTSPRPFGVGTTREAKVLGGAIKVQEHFFLWEEGRRKSFYVTKANLPVFKSLAEDYVVEPDGPSACRFTWTIALEPTAAGKAGGPANTFLFKRLFAQTRRHFDAG